MVTQELEKTRKNIEETNKNNKKKKRKK